MKALVCPRCAGKGELLVKEAGIVNFYAQFSPKVTPMMSCSFCRHTGTVPPTPTWTDLYVSERVVYLRQVMDEAKGYLTHLRWQKAAPDVITAVTTWHAEVAEELAGLNKPGQLELFEVAL